MPYVPREPRIIINKNTQRRAHSRRRLETIGGERGEEIKALLMGTVDTMHEQGFNVDDAQLFLSLFADYIDDEQRNAPLTPIRHGL